MEKTISETIELAYYEATIINSLLNRNRRIFDSDYCLFDQEELASIKEVTIKGVDSVSFLNYLPNVEVLTITSSNYAEVLDGASYNTQYFNNIDQESLNEALKRLPNLKELTINNDLSIRQLDITSNKQLEVLNIDNNPELREIIGLSELHRLKRVKLFGNNINNIRNFDAYLFNTLDTENNIIDISIFLSVLNIFDNTETKIKYLDHLENLNLKGLINIKFSEKNGLSKYNVLEFWQIEELTRKCLLLFKKLNIYHLSDKEKVDYVLKYIKNNIKFDKNGLIEREQFLSYYNENGRVPAWGNNYVSHLHNSYSTYRLKTGNCEGIVNLMKIMLSILGIESYTVQCIDKRHNDVVGNNHALIRIKIDNNWYYFDPAFAKTVHGNYDYMTYEDASKYLALPLYERIKTGERENEKSTLHH